MASHWYLGLLIKKQVRRVRGQYLAIKHVNDTFTFEERSFASVLGLESMLPAEQLPTKKLIELVQTVLKKRQSLCQLVVCKFAVNSLDTHYILAKAGELQSIY